MAWLAHGDRATNFLAMVSPSTSEVGSVGKQSHFIRETQISETQCGNIASRKTARDGQVGGSKSIKILTNLGTAHRCYEGVCTICWHLPQVDCGTLSWFFRIKRALTLISPSA